LNLTGNPARGDVDTMAYALQGGRRSHCLHLAGLASLVFTAIFAITVGPAIASGDAAEVEPIVDAVELEIMLPGALPPPNLRMSDLDAVRRISDRAALGRAMREAETHRRRVDAGEFEPEQRYRRPSNPQEARQRIQEEYGPDSILTRSAGAVAAIADGVEKGSAKPFAGMADVTESIVNRSGEALGFGKIDVPRLKPRIIGRRAGVYVSTRW